MLYEVITNDSVLWISLQQAPVMEQHGEQSGFGDEFVVDVGLALEDPDGALVLEDAHAVLQAVARTDRVAELRAVDASYNFV